MACSNAKTSGIRVTAMRDQCFESKPIRPRTPQISVAAFYRAAPLTPTSAFLSGLHELHLRAREFQQVAVLQRHRLRSDGRAVESRFVAPLDVRHDDPVRALRDRGHRH